MQRNKLVLGAVVLLSAVVVTAASVRSVAADQSARDRGETFSDRTLKGYWGFSTSFSMLLPPAFPEEFPGAGLGRMYFDGNGGCSIRLWANVNGVTTETFSSTCSYEVNADGTGKSEADFPDLSLSDPLRVVFVIVDDRRELRFLNTESIVSTFSARRQ